MARSASRVSMTANWSTSNAELASTGADSGRMASGRPASRLALLPLALLLSACETSFKPDIQPLVIPTLPPQPFGAEVSQEDLQPPAQQPVAGQSGQEEPFDPEDPDDWIRRIEAQWTNINVISCQGDDTAEECMPWPAEELELLYETLGEHILAGYLDQGILMIRTESENFAGLTINWAIGDVRSSDVRISDAAWRSSPALGFFDLFDPLFETEDHLQGTIAHELTHAAVWFHPELLEWWLDAQEAAGESLEPGDWRVGYRYEWSVYEQLEDDPELYQQTAQGELFAMTIAALMYDPWWVRGE